MTDTEGLILSNYLDATQPFNFQGTQRYSTLIAALRDCRQNTKRNIETGNYDPEAASGDEGNWLGTLGYFTILDQIGSCFRPISKPEVAENENSIEYSIKHFGYDLINNENRQLQAIKSLRNSFTHDFNLLNIPKSKSLPKIALERHKFTVTVDISKPLWIVKLPNERQLWDGNLEFKDFSNQSDVTFINLFGIAELVEAIYLNICALHESHQLETNLSIKSMINKYTFMIFPATINNGG